MHTSRSMMLAPILFLILSVLLPGDSIAAPAKTPQQAPVPQKSTQPAPVADPAKPEDFMKGAPGPASAGSVLTADPGESKKSAPISIDQSDAGQTDKNDNKILATVNGSNITKADYDRYLMQRGVNANSNAITQLMIDEAFEGLINEVLARDYVAKLGRLNDPLLEKRITTLRYQAIVEYFQYLVATSMKPLSEADLQAFIAEHPDYFKDRRYYYFTSLDFVKNNDVDVSQLRSFLNSSDNFDKITLALNSKKINYTLFRGYRPSEQINENVFTKLKTMSPGESAIVTDPETNQVFIFKLFSSSPDPIDADKKREEVRMAVVMGKVNEQTRDLIQQLRASSDIKIIDKPKPSVSTQPGKFAATNARVNTASAGLFKKFDRRGKQVTDAGDFAKDIATSEDRNQTQSETRLLIAYIRNIWILSLFLILPATFYHFLKTSNTMYSDLVLNNAQAANPDSSSSYKLQKILLDPVITWIIGIVLTLLIAYFARDGFNEKNLYTLYISKKFIAISVLSALAASALLIFLTNKLYPKLPAYVKNLRLFLFSIVLISNILILKVL
jgi:EpsD family peptidyl-prolyl cis-trans isomerase